MTASKKTMNSSRTSIRPSRNYLPVACLVLVFLALTGCKKTSEPAVEVTVQAEKPEKGTISERVTADAVLTPLAQAAIEPKIAAPVKKFYVQRGDRVKQGQLLATLENADLVAAAVDNKGAYQAAEAAYNTATKSQVPEDVQKAELDLAQANANLSLNQSIVKSRKQLFAEGAIPGRDLDTAQAALVQAQAAYDTAEKHLQSMQKVNRAAALEAAQGQLTSAKGKLSGADAMVSYSEIRSPIDGYVTDRPLFAGETAAASTPLITVMDTSVLIAKAHVAQSVAQQLKIGDSAQLLVPGADKPFPAKVSLISPALDSGSTTLEIWLKVDNRSGALKAGTPVKALITGHTIQNASKIPQTAVLSAENGTKSVMIIGPDGAAHRKPVTLGITDGDDVQVLSGLSPEDTVITVGSYGLDEGTRVKVGPPESDDSAAPAKHGSDD